jgi:outer membrane protein assembly factor BamB
VPCNQPRHPPQDSCTRYRILDGAPAGQPGFCSTGTSPPAFVDPSTGQAYANRTGSIQAFAADGTLLWTGDPADVIASSAGASGTVMTAKTSSGSDSVIRAYDPSGTLLWSLTLPGFGAVASLTVLRDGVSVVVKGSTVSEWISTCTRLLVLP